jgi:hypothetical protein
MMALITGVLGIAMLGAFLGIMLVWVPALPLIVIVVTVMLLLVYDFVMTVRYGENHATPAAVPPKEHSGAKAD